MLSPPTVTKRRGDVTLSRTDATARTSTGPTHKAGLPTSWPLALMALARVDVLVLRH